MVLDSFIKDGELSLYQPKLSIDSSKLHYLIMKNKKGLRTYDVDLLSGNVYLAKEGTQTTSRTMMTIANNLNFQSDVQLILGDSTHLKILNSDTNAITNFSSNRFIRTSHQSGMLIRSMSSTNLPKNYFFPVVLMKVEIVILRSNTHFKRQLTVVSLELEFHQEIKEVPAVIQEFTMLLMLNT